MLLFSMLSQQRGRIARTSLHAGESRTAVAGAQHPRRSSGREAFALEGRGLRLGATLKKNPRDSS